MSLRARVQSPHGADADYDLDAPEVVIGRGATAGIVIPDTRVSRQHARIVRRDGGWWVEDLGARNRTLLNGEAVAGAARLRAGDRLDVGDSVVRFFDPAAEAPPDAASPPRPAGDTTYGPGPSARGERPGANDARRLGALNDIHRALTESLSLSDLLDLILARCFDVLDPEEGVIMLRGADGALASVAHRRLSPGPGPVTIPKRLVDEVAGKARPALVLDAAYDERFAGSASIVSSGFRSIVAAPLVDGEGTLGLITLCSRVAVRRFTQADLDMLVSIASAVALRVRNVALADALAERRVVEHELALARDVQMAMLPRRMPDRREVTLAARLVPARSVGGDLYDFVLADDRLWFIVADAAGKSIAAALYVAIVKTLFRAMTQGEAHVATVVARMNRELARENDRLMFVTAAVGSLDLRSGALALVDAGHNPVALVQGARRLGLPDVPKGVALGVVEHASYAAAHLTMAPGSTLVLYTDGLTDARSTSGAMFGAERLDEAIAAAGGATPEALVAAVTGAVEQFAAGAPPDDDMTILAVRYSGGG